MTVGERSWVRESGQIENDVGGKCCSKTGVQRLYFIVGEAGLVRAEFREVQRSRRNDNRDAVDAVTVGCLQTAIIISVTCISAGSRAVACTGTGPASACIGRLYIA